MKISMEYFNNALLFFIINFTLNRLGYDGDRGIVGVKVVLGRVA